MYQKFTKTLACFIFMFCFFALQAQTVHNLNHNSTQGATSLVSMSNSVPQELFTEAKATRAFTINPILQNANSVSMGDIIDLKLFEDKNYTATVSDIITDVNGNFTLTLKLSDYPMAFGFVTTNTNGKSLFSVSIPELNQRFTSRDNIDSQTSFLIELNNDINHNLKNDYKEILTKIVIEDNQEKKTNTANLSIPESSRGTVNCTRDPNLIGTDPVTISLLIVYTPAAADWANKNEGGINNTIAGAMAQIKAVLDNQKNGDNIVLLHSQQINYTEFAGDGMETDLKRLTNVSDGYMDEVHQLRKQYGADIVSLFENYNGIGGVGWVLSDTINGRYDYAFNVIRVQQASGTITLIHEIGHNMGMRHEVENNSGTPLYPYAFGWYWTGTDSKQYGSVMSYTGLETQYFSNPNENYKGKPTGTATANNARVFRNTKHIVAFYSDKLNIVPDIPINIVVSNPINNGATFSWDACENAVKYEFCTLYGTTSYLVWPTTNNSLSINDDEIFKPCTSYQIWVIAFNECGDEVESKTITFKTKCTTDPTVTTSAATAITYNSATLNKNVTANGATVTSQGFKYKEMSAADWSTSTTGNLTDLKPNTQYKFYAYAVTAQGTFNSNVWTFKTLVQPWHIGSPTPSDVIATLDNGTLTIEGIGLMMNWKSPQLPPWYTQKNNIKNIIINSAVTSIGTYAFESCSYLTNMTVNWVNPIVIDSSVFSNVNLPNVNLNVPAGARCEYTSAPIWQNFNIIKSSQTINFPALPTKIYGDAPVTLSATTNAGLPIGYQSSNTAVATTSDNILTIINAGTTEITATQNGDCNYTAVTPIVRILTVNKAQLTVTADDKSRKYGEENPIFTLSYSGWKNSDNVNSLTTIPVASCSATQTSNAGTYPIVVSGGAANNYSFIYQNGTLTVTNNSSIDEVIVKDFYIYPNPVHNGETIHITDMEGEAVISLIDLNGKVLKTELFNNASNEIALSISEIPTGMYFVRIITDKITKVVKVVVR